MRFWVLTDWPCTTGTVSPLAETWLVFGVHDAIMEHGYGMGQRGGVIIRQAPAGTTAGWQADFHKAVSWTCWAGVRGCLDRRLACAVLSAY